MALVVILIYFSDTEQGWIFTFQRVGFVHEL